MHDGGKILTGLLIFLAVLTLPFWKNALGTTPPPPQPKIVTAEKQCVYDKTYMQRYHMEVLDHWRNTVVREGRRTYVDERTGKTVLMSLSGTCMRCHPNKREFCDQCHTYMAVTPYCWECHVEPEEKP